MEVQKQYSRKTVEGMREDGESIFFGGGLPYSLK